MSPQIRALLERADEFHKCAMDSADRATILRLQGRPAEGQRSLQQAFEMERDAADLLIGTDVPALSRSVYHRSAASLAIEVQNWNEAKRLIDQGLWGTPPPSIALELEELRQVVEAAHDAPEAVGKPVALRP